MSDNNILQISTQVIYPITDGGKQAIIAHTRLLKDWNISVYGIMSNADSDCGDWRQYVPEFKDVLILPRCHSKFAASPLITIAEWLFSFKPRQAQVIESESNRELVMRYIEQNNIKIVLLEGIFGVEHISIERLQEMGIRLINIAHNVEYILRSEVLKKYRFLKQPEVELTYNYEKKYLPLMDRVITVSPFDAEMIKQKFRLNNVCYLPMPMQVSVHQWSDTEADYIVFPGSLGFYANYYSMQWFYKNVFLSFVKRCSHVRLLITGKADDKLRDTFAHPNVEFTGYVQQETLTSLMTHCLFMISPIIIGSGVKLKLLEGLSMGMPIIASRHCHEGVPYSSNTISPYLVADTADDYLHFMVELTESSIRRKRLAMNAREFFITEYSSEKNRLNWYRELLGGASEAPLNDQASHKAVSYPNI